jgi:hypothetical protein
MADLSRPVPKKTKISSGGYAVVGATLVWLSFLFKLHPVSTVYAGPMFLEQVTEVMQWYREFISQAPEDINGFFAFLVVPPGPPFPQHLHNKTMCGIVWCYTGPLDRAEKTFEPIPARPRP